MIRRPISAVTLILGLCFRVDPAFAQAVPSSPGPGPNTNAASVGATDSLTHRRGGVQRMADPGSPRGAVAGYLAAARAGDYQRAGTYLDLSELSPEERAGRGTLLARQLKIVLDHKLWIDLEDISEEPPGNLNDGLPRDLEGIGTIMTRYGPSEIRLRRSEDAATGISTWRFSPRLVERIPELYQEYGLGPIGDRMPPALYKPRFLEIELWQWLGLIIAAAIAYGFAVPFMRAVGWLLRYRAARKHQPLPDQRLLHTLRLQAQLVVALGVFLVLALFVMRLPIPARSVLLRVGQIFLVLLVTWMLIKIVGALWSKVRERLQREDRRSAVTLAILGERLSKATLIALAAIVVLQQLGFQITGLLAGLGVGGVAVALAAQKTIANLFGGFYLATDQPVRLGDLCRFGDKSGWVEDIGMRSTRIRTLDRSVITVPNAEFAEVQLENLSARDRMRLSAGLGLRYETTPDQLRHVLAGLEKLLAEDPRVLQDPLRVRFSGFGPYSLNIEIMTYIATSDYDQFLAIREELFLKMMDIVRESGTGIAFPSQTVYSAEDSGLNRERTARAEAATRAHVAPRSEARDTGDR